MVDRARRSLRLTDLEERVTEIEQNLKDPEALIFRHLDRTNTPQGPTPWDT